MARDDRAEPTRPDPGPGAPARADQARLAQLHAIVERGRRTRKRTPRWLWLASLAVGAVCAVGFAAMMLAEPEPAPAAAAGRRAGHRGSAGSGLGIGLAIGVGAGFVIGFAISRQRGDHSSRNNP